MRRRRSKPSNAMLPHKPVQPDSVAKQEFEYTRHGTTTLTAGLDVVTGQIVSPTLEATRTEPGVRRPHRENREP